jgi:hypothetical protein
MGVFQKKMKKYDSQVHTRHNFLYNMLFKTGVYAQHHTPPVVWAYFPKKKKEKI